MRLYRNVILFINLSLTLLPSNSLSWGQQVGRFANKPIATSQVAVIPQNRERIWTVKGIVRKIIIEINWIIITHDEIPGYMGAMTMPFEVVDSRLLEGLAVGDRIEFTVKEQDRLLFITSIKKESSQ